MSFPCINNHTLTQKPLSQGHEFHNFKRRDLICSLTKQGNMVYTKFVQIISFVCVSIQESDIETNKLFDCDVFYIIKSKKQFFIFEIYK